jgi:hypothetical protein
MDRAACRSAVEARFAVDRMTEQYLALYGRLIASSSKLL